MIAAPRCCTVGMNVPSSQLWSPTTSAATLPFTSAWKRSGYWVAEWLPQIVIFVMSLTVVPVFAASCASAQLWSRRGIAVKRPVLVLGAVFFAVGGVGLGGVATTR